MAILSSTDARAQLEALTASLLFVSESDFPLTVTQVGNFGDLDEATLLATLGKPQSSAVERITVDDFFGYAAQDQPWHTAEERSVAARYRSLLEFFRTALADARVFRIGVIEVDAYALGRSSDGKWLGVATKLVET